MTEERNQELLRIVRMTPAQRAKWNREPENAGVREQMADAEFGRRGGPEESGVDYYEQRSNSLEDWEPDLDIKGRTL